jgi:hypothetical protein
MLKRRIVTILAGLALLASVTGSAGIVADHLGLAVTPPAHADPCNGGGSC